MDKAVFDEIKAKLDKYAYTSLEYTVFEPVADYEVLRFDDEAVFLFGYNAGAEANELHFAVGQSPNLLMETAMSLPNPLLVTFVPPCWKGLFLASGFGVYGELSEYWMDEITVPPGADADEITYAEESEYAAVSDVTKSVRLQSREFYGESPEDIAQWANGSNPYALDSGTADCEVIVRRVENQVVGAVCVGIYGHDSPKGPVLWLREIAVRPEFQGKGIGRVLVGQTLAYGAQKGAKRAFLLADDCNERAVKLYKDVGFIPNMEESQIDMIIDKER